ncbi:MAG: methylmalonyl-CoA mutase, partial [Oceanospirillaceae bacterium]
MPKLFEEFGAASLKDWKNLTEKELKGADINNLNQWLESDGFTARPAYFKDETEKLPMYGQTIRPLRFNQKNNDWLICAEVMVGDIGETNTEILHKLSLGANALNIDINGIDLASDEIAELFHDVVIDAIAISFTNAYNSLRFQSDYLEWAKGKQIKGGFWFSELNADLAASLIAGNDQHAFGGIGLNTNNFYMKGASISQQLGASMAWGNELLSGLREKGISFEQVSDNLGFSFATGSSLLPEIAKFRLIRFLWARVMQQHGAANKRWKTWVHAQTGERHLSSL